MDEHAIVLRYLELRASSQAEALAPLVDEAAALAERARAERLAGDAVLVQLGAASATTVVDGQLSLPPQGTHLPVVVSWRSVTDDAAATLARSGIDPASIRLPPSPHDLDRMDVAASITIGTLAALLPSLGSRRGTVQDAFREVQRSADSGNLPRLIQGVFGRHPAPFMDAGAAGMYHRFCDGHDLLAALPVAVSKFGWIAGPVQVFQHLLTDSFGATGIPLPGSDAIGRAVAQLAGVSSISDVVSPRDLSRFASLRMTDTVSAGLTSALVAGYLKARRIPEDSMRGAELGVLAHGLCLVGVAATASIPGLMHLVPYRSHVNYVSLIGFVRNALLWHRHSTELEAQIVANFARIDSIMAALERSRASASLENGDRELAFAAQLLAGAGETT